MLVPVPLSIVGEWLVVMGFPSTPTGFVMLVPVPLCLTGSSAGAGGVGCCAKATPVSVTVDTIAIDMIQAVRVMILTSLVMLAAGGPVPGLFRGSGRVRQRPMLVQEDSREASKGKSPRGSSRKGAGSADVDAARQGLNSDPHAARFGC
jgi:hypothetical protein